MEPLGGSDTRLQLRLLFDWVIQSSVGVACDERRFKRPHQQ
jgi:hypothetical protein